MHTQTNQGQKEIPPLVSVDFSVEKERCNKLYLLYMIVIIKWCAIGIRQTILSLGKNTPSSNANHTIILFQKEFPEKKFFF